MPMLRTKLGVGSTLEASGVADEIRRGIDASAVDGDLVRILADGGYSTRRTMEYFTALLDAQRRERWLILTVVVFACLLGFTVAAAYRIRRQRNLIKSTEEALRKSEQKLRLLANNLSEMVLVYDMDRRLIFANAAVEQLTGYSPEELQQDQFIGWVHPDDRARILANREALFQGGSCREEEYRLTTKQGAVRWVAATWGLLYDETGRQVGIQGSERDITEKKLAEQALRESERRFRELLEGVQLVAIITDLSGTIGFCNDYALSLTGWSRHEIIGRPAGQLLDAAFPLQVADGTDLALPSGEQQPFFEGTIQEKSGGRRWIQWSSTLLRDSSGRPAGFASLGADVTELRTLRSEAARRESEERFRSIADSSPLMIWVSGPDKGCTFVNKGWLTFTGHTLDQELGDGWTSNIHPDDLEYCLATYRAAFDARRKLQLEYRKRRADGEYRWVLGMGMPRFGPDGDFAGYIGNCNDITELKLHWNEDATRQKLETIGRLAGGIAHDFNNLMGGVLAQADLALAELAAGADAREQLNNIRGVAVRGAGIVRQLLIYSGQENAVSEPVDVSVLIDDMLDLLKVVVSKHAVLKTDLGRGLPAIQANPAQLRQVVMNMITNASEAIGERDGVIVIRTAQGRGGADRLQGGSDGCIELEISDTGCGISREAQSKIFDPFFTTKSAGHGLGLAVVQRIVQGLGGTIQLDAESGNGTRFRIVLPGVSQGASPRRPVALPLPAEEAAEPAIVLVVEDEAILRLAVSRVLRAKGFSVVEAADGTQAIALIRGYKESIGAVLLDITLPGAPSRDVLAEIRRLRPSTKVIVTSAYGENKVGTAFPGMEIDSFLRKPYQIAELVRLLHRVLSTEEQSRANASQGVT
jgi:two-component system, cell cycle sensor histidine kinase and response regulator CckA